MTDKAVEARRQRSASLFNNRYFAECAVHVLSLPVGGQDMFTVRQVASASGLADSLVRPVLLRLCDAHVVEKLPRMGAGRSPQYFRVVDVDLLRWVALDADLVSRK